MTKQSSGLLYTVLWSSLMYWPLITLPLLASQYCIVPCRQFVFQLRRISNDAGMPVIKDPYFYRYVSGLENVEPLFRQLKQERPELQLIMVILPGKTPVYGEGVCVCACVRQYASQ